MKYEISQLGANDFEEAIDFMNMVFSMSHQPTDFTKLLPAYYKPTEEHMNCHHVIKTEGKIRALVGIYPGEMMVGNSAFKAARIGAVSTHPYFQGHGMMQELMNHCVDYIKQEGCDISVLSGFRHRYLYYGYEKCGYKLTHLINKKNIKHCGVKAEDVEIRPIFKEDSELTRYYKSLNDKQKIHFLRSEEDFYDLCMNGKSKLFGIFKQGKPAGYIATTRNGDNITEINTENSNLTYEAINAFAASIASDRVVVNLSPLDMELNRKLGQICEAPEIKGQCNWCIYNWELAVSAYMSVKNSVTPLQEGKIVLGIKDYGNLSIEVNGGLVTCEKTKEAAVLEVDPSAAARLLFGPLLPSYVLDLPKAALILDNWCPLPLYLSSQDFA